MKTSRQLLELGSTVYLPQLVIDMDDTQSASASWLRELYDSQSICCICGRPFFQLSKIGDNCSQGPVCGNTCSQKRRRGTLEGTWFLALTQGTGIDWRDYPQTVRELINHPQRQQIKGSPNFDVIGWDDNKTAVVTPPVVIETDDIKPVVVTPPVVIETDDTQAGVSVKDQRCVDTVLATIERCKRDGIKCGPAQLFPATPAGLAVFNAVVRVLGPSMAKAAKALGFSAQAMRGRPKRIRAGMAGEKMQ